VKVIAETSEFVPKHSVNIKISTFAGPASNMDEQAFSDSLTRPETGELLE
jgi:hypothetical protein